MKNIFDKVSYKCSELTTQKYSTSFYLGIKLLTPDIQLHICAIYGFVRFADEIVDTFHEYDKKTLLEEFETETYKAIKNKISLNPILQSFQQTVNQYNIDKELIDTFLFSMKMDLNPQDFTQALYEKYILGSAEVVGLMCLKVFTNGNEELYQQLKPSAMKLGSVFQKVNFLRDLGYDYNELGRMYFPNVDFNSLSEREKLAIFQDIEQEFDDALVGIKQLPNSSKFGVYLAYKYYRKLFNKIKKIEINELKSKRIRIPNEQKYFILLRALVRHKLSYY